MEECELTAYQETQVGVDTASYEAVILSIFAFAVLQLICGAMLGPRTLAHLPEVLEVWVLVEASGSRY
jgi:hypothetical protein